MFTITGTLRVAEPAQQPDRHDLQAVEHLEHAGDRQQQDREREHGRIGRVEPREQPRRADEQQRHRTP